MPTAESDITMGQRIAVLIADGIDPQGRHYSIPQAAAAAGVSDQALFNLISGKSASPLIATLLGLSQLYGIRLSYFDLPTEDACRRYLAHHQLQVAPPLVREIDAAVRQLSPKGQRNIRALLKWMGQ